MSDSISPDLTPRAARAKQRAVFSSELFRLLIWVLSEASGSGALISRTILVHGSTPSGNRSSRVSHLVRLQHHHLGEDDGRASKPAIGILTSIRGKQ